MLDQRHAARAAKVDVQLSADDGEIQLTVTDNGCGFAPQAHIKPDSFGLFGMNERAQHLGGTVAVESAPGKGTRVVMHVPRTASNLAVASRSMA